MLSHDEKQKILLMSENAGNMIIKLAKNKTSFGSFFLEGYNDTIMTYLPYFQQAIWVVPMNNNGTIWEYHDYNQLDQIKNYDFAIIFKHQNNKQNAVLVEEATKYGKDKYFIVIQTKDEENIGDIMTLFMRKFMVNNPYLNKI